MYEEGCLIAYGLNSTSYITYKSPETCGRCKILYRSARLRGKGLIHNTIVTLKRDARLIGICSQIGVPTIRVAFTTFINISNVEVFRTYHADVTIDVQWVHKLLPTPLSV